MIETPVSSLQPGLILGRHVLDKQGRTVMQAGSRLTPMTIKRLQKWDIESVFIQDESTQELQKQEAIAQGKTVLESATEADREFMRRIAERVQHRFRHVDDSILMSELKRLAVRHIVLSGRGVIPRLK